MRLFSAATADRDSLGKTEISLWVYDGGFDCGFKSVSLVNLATEVYGRRFQRRLLIQVILESKWSFSVWIYGYRRFFKVMEWLSIRVDDRRLLIRLFIGSNGIPRGWIHGHRWILKATESYSMIFGDLCLGLMIVFRSMRIWNQEESEGCCVFRFGFKAKQWGLVPGRDLKAYGPILGFLIDVLLALGLCALVWLDMLVPGGGRYLFRLTLVFCLYWEFEFLEWSLNGIHFSDCDVLSDFEFVLVAVWFWAVDQRFFRLKTIEKRRLDRGVFNRWLFNNRNGRALISFQRASVDGHNFSKRRIKGMKAITRCTMVRCMV
ncbi:predicted protein [Arabidopsis lyrata subsp. lyrata]|uniref:Predicted protein n=1 Tax=Arabidopsis lyrata subsp. lyrata TaxID=81972 RepID=D7MWF1_ARALL|nr:predicted protein [Arabidopsis lyrata subsp. lyrata]